MKDVIRNILRYASETSAADLRWIIEKDFGHLQQAFNEKYIKSVLRNMVSDKKVTEAFGASIQSIGAQFDSALWQAIDAAVREFQDRFNSGIDALAEEIEANVGA